MNLSFADITFIIVTYKSEKIIDQCINSLPINSNKIIIENSKNINLKRELENKYDNIEVILNENIGMGASNNIGIKKTNTKYAYVVNPDTKFNEESLNKIIDALNEINDFSILSPLISDRRYPNFKKYNNYENFSENIISVDSVDGFSMLINKEKFKDNLFFDENFFLYLENDDLCLRVKKNGGKIYLLKNSIIDHFAASSSSETFSQDREYLRNWHWMWSKFYFNKKHFGYFMAFRKTFLNFVSSLFKSILFLIIFNFHKSKIYRMRFLGLYNSMLGSKSWFRI